MNSKVKIGKKFVGDGEPVFIIAELGSNHGNKLSQAIELIDVASDSGADAVKLQLYTAWGLWPKYSRAYKIFENIQTNREWLKKLLEHARRKNIILFATPFDKNAVDLMDRLDTPVFKWASSELFDLPLLKYAAAKKRPMILATGVSNIADIQKAVNTVRRAGNNDIIILHCVSAYPTKPEEANLRMMDSIKAALNVPVGFSDHTLGISVPIAAVARGACVIEKHFTLSRKLKGPDHVFAVEPDELKEMVTAIREVERSLGSGVKSPVSGAENEDFFVRLFVAKNIRKGTRLTKDMIVIKRSDYGIMPEYYDTIVGRETKSDLKADYPITWDVV